MKKRAPFNLRRAQPAAPGDAPADPAGREQPLSDSVAPIHSDIAGPAHTDVPRVAVTDERAEVREALAEQPASRVEVASQWQLIWWRFRQSPLALVGLVTLLGIYLVALLAEFVAPFPPDAFSARYTYAPPQRLLFIDRSGGGFRVQPYVYGYKVEVDPRSFQRKFTIDESRKYPVRLFARGAEYKLLGLIPLNIHLLGPVEEDAPMYLLGADGSGRDMLSRLIYGTRISMSVGLVGVALSLVLGILLGGVSGYYSGSVDLLIQRIIEFLHGMPTLPIWLGLAAALPPQWGPLRVYFGITVILSLIGWTGLARVVRGRFLSLREEDFVAAARLDGVSELRIILRHILPSFASHIIASLTLAIPAMILGETALSFLGLGLRPPIVSWGVLLQGGQSVRAIATAPWLLLPALAVMFAVMALYLVGDGLRDAADPYAA